jgi:hypothetical protein
MFLVDHPKLSDITIDTAAAARLWMDTEEPQSLCPTLFPWEGWTINLMRKK